MTDWHRIAQDMAADLEAISADLEDIAGDADLAAVVADAARALDDAARRWRHEIWLAELADSAADHLTAGTATASPSQDRGNAE
jgi:hypothetical protein